MKKEPTKKDLATILLLGLCMSSFGLLFVWLPPIGWPLLFLGGILILLYLVTITTMLFKKVLK